MFLSRRGSSGRFMFSEIYSALQKSMRKGDLTLSLEMAKEFKEYPNALKKRLLQNCCEDCPNIYLINDIYNTPPVLEKLIEFIPAICNHVKCREGLLAFRVACEMDHIFEPITKDDNDLLTLCRKCFTILCQNKDVGDKIVNVFQSFIPGIDLMKIYKFLSRNRTFIYMLCVWKCLKYPTIEKYEKPKIGDDFDINKYNVTELPEFVYDKHVSSSKKENKGYKYFIENMVLYPRMEKTDLEKEGERLYIETNKAAGDYIRPIIKKYETLNDNVKLIQTQLITGKSKPKTFFCDADNDNTYKYILKGPYKTISEMNALILADYIKGIFGLVSTHSRIVKYQNQNYIMSDNLIDIEPENTICKTSALEINVSVYNGDLSLYSHDKLNVSILIILLFRKIIGTNDTCTRNIVLSKDGNYASIDDPVLLKETDHMFKISLNEKLGKMYNDCLKENFEVISELIKKYIDIVKNDKKLNDKQKEFMLKQLEIYSHRYNWIF